MREARQIVIFPEGTRGAPDQPLTLQPGIAALAARTGLPVIPVITDSGLCWGRRAFHKHPGVIHIRIRPPIEAGTPREILMRKLDSVFRSEIDTVPEDRCRRMWTSLWADRLVICDGAAIFRRNRLIELRLDVASLNWVDRADAGDCWAIGGRL